jgi:hypothetical protein
MANYDDVFEAAGKQFNVDPKLLKAMMAQESSGNPNAVSPKGAAGLMQLMPATAKEVGVTNPNDPAQNIMGGARYMSQMLDKFGDVPTALAAYNAGPGAVSKAGGIPNFPETQNYVSRITANYQGKPMAQQSTMPGLPPTADAGSAGDDPFSKLMTSGGSAPAAAPAKGAPAAAPAGGDDPFSKLMASKPAAPAQPAKPGAQGHDTGPLDIIGGAVEPIATMATGALGSLAGGITRLGAAALGSNYKDAQATGNKVADALTYHPQTQGGQQALAGLSASATGIKNAVMGSPVGPALSAVGNAYDNTFVKGATNPLMATINDQVPTVTANLVAPAAISAIKGAPNALRAAVAKPIAAAERVEPSIGGANPAPAGAGFQDASQPKSTMYTGADGTTSTTPPAGSPNASAQGATLRGVGAAEANMNPYAGMTGEEAARGGSSAFPQVKTSKIAADVPEADQIKRADIVRQILGDDNGQIRPGVITGNEDKLRSEYTHAKSSDNTLAQIALREQIAHEQTALSNYAQQRVEATGANPNLINNEQRGQVINDAFHGEGGLSDYFKQAKNQIYDRAKAESGDNPIQSTHVDKLLNDPKFLAEAERNGHTGVVTGAQKLIDLARSTGFEDSAPGSVAAWDAVRKSNNSGWSPDNSRTIGAINRAIDQDVAAAAGSDAYKLGDAVHKAEKTIMDVPAISKIFGGADANGIKDGTSLEKLTSKLNNMPLDQWRHVYNTLDDLSRGIVRGAPDGMPPVPQELQQLAGAARNEISGALAREVHEQGAGKTGAWNQNSVNKTLNSVVGQKITETFPPDEVQRFHTLNYGGQIMPGVHSYEGAALQKQRLSKPGFYENHVAKAASALGGALGGAISGGAAAGAGAGAGSWVGNKLAGRSAASRLEGEANKLREIMRENYKRGQ